MHPEIRPDRPERKYCLRTVGSKWSRMNELQLIVFLVEVCTLHWVVTSNKFGCIGLQPTVIEAVPKGQIRVHGAPRTKRRSLLRSFDQVMCLGRSSIRRIVSRFGSFRLGNKRKRRSRRRCRNFPKSGSFVLINRKTCSWNLDERIDAIGGWPNVSNNAK